MRHLLALVALLLTTASVRADGYRVWYAAPGSDWAAGTFTYPTPELASISADAFRRDGYAVSVVPDGYRPVSPPRPAPQRMSLPATPHCPPQAPPVWPLPPQAPPARTATATTQVYQTPVYYYVPQPAYYLPSPGIRYGYGGVCVGST